VTGAIGPDFAAPRDDRYLEDYVPGSSYRYGSATLDEASIIAFARDYDPQPFHIDPAAALDGVYGGLIASGWHTACVMMRILVDHVLSPVSSLGSPGCDELRWLKPVRPGDTLSVRITFHDSRRSRSKPDRGLVAASIEILNQADEVVMTMKTTLYLRARDPEPPEAA
jgi:acyl dehydratase